MHTSKVKTRNLFTLALVLTLLVIASSLVINRTSSQGKIPDTIVLAKQSKLGQVTFNHTKHATENRNAAMDGPIACVECHHTAQPAAEAAKNPPHKTAYPADRTTTLSLDLLASDPKAVGAICTDCQDRK